MTYSITAFPVLARILTELKLLSTPVGLTTLAAGVGNDVIGWILLALSVALANSGAGISALYILLTMVGIVLFLWLLVKPVFHCESHFTPVCFHADGHRSPCPQVLKL